MTAPVQPRGRIRSFGFAVVGLGAFTLTASSSAPSPLYPVYQQMWGFSAAMLTVVFAVYVLALLAALVTVGSLSDHVGRRPVIVTALLLLAASMVVFIASPGVGWLIVARILQGLAVGAATSALAAAVIEMQPNRHIGPLINTAAPSLGLALGAAGAGVLVQFAPLPTVLSYAVVGVLAVVLAIALIFVPETSPSVGFPSRRDALRSLVPSASVPREVRGRYLLILPSLMSAWALGGLYMSLGPSIVDSVFGIDNRLAAGLAIGTLFTAGTVAATTTARRDPHRIVILGAVLLATGLAAVITALLTGWVAAYYAGTAVAGFGWGSTFVAAMGVVGSLGRPHERGRIFATTFVVCYFAFSVPAMAAGVAAGSFGLMSTAVGYGVVVAVLALVAGVGVLVRKPKPDSAGMREVPVPARS
ncbi:MFS transporter [Rhodococcus pyridinivorans]|uniref:MFS transporter n=1 Tax=Rhodococcus pyridinivorans TaxID=103816 RepID=UPI0002FA14A1|nr:MFS transporter [Rhodococcus pyridinivorans]AWZ26100.1 MFS transporter [Rhodococcus pyridinivorans]UGQ59406.1 MFS transporter [Rhodococcus pyridinivorans]UVT24480.1 MFS transporter [Rhodococcus pyridinivorans]